MSILKKRIFIYLALACTLGVSFLGAKIFLDPTAHILTSQTKARWIVFPEQFSLYAKQYKFTVTAFRTTINIANEPSRPELSISVFKQGKIFVDGNLVEEINVNAIEWKKTNQIALDNIAPGTHDLVIGVGNFNGPPALLVSSDDLNIYSDESWFAYREGVGDWVPVMLANDRRIAEISTKFQSTTSALGKTIPMAVILTALYIAGVIITKKYNIAIFKRTADVRWGLVALYSVMAVNSLIKAEPSGFDVLGHIEYIKFIVEQGKLPLATDGSQMFQSPLYYMISAILYKFLLLFGATSQILNFLTIIPLLCGLAMIEICYRTSLHAFPNRQDLQKLCTIIGSFIPMNLYMSQYLGNEPLAAIFTALAILLTVAFLNEPQLATTRKHQVFLGASLGLALLSKVTAVLLIVPVFLAFIIIQHQQNQSLKRITTQVGTISLVIITICGWYYLRNWILLGKPFIGGWDPSREIFWWQDPGYRTFNDFLTFGYVFVNPIYAATTGFWDAIYSTIWLDGFLGGKAIFKSRPHWNYDFVLSSVWLAIIPTLGIMAGMVRSIYSVNKNRALVAPFATSCVAIYFVAVLYLYLVLPIYSTAKASYTLGLLPCYAILCVYGLNLFMKSETLKHVFSGIIVLWASYSYIGYFQN